MRQQGARIRKAKAWLYKISVQDAPTMAEMWGNVAKTRYFKSNAATIRNLKLSAQVLMFIQHNGIDDFAQFTVKVEQMYKRHYDVANSIKEKTRRINTLTVHLEQCDIKKQHRAVYQKYTKLDPKKRKAYAEKHAEEIRLYKEAADYIKGVMNGRAEPPPIKKWKAELETLTAERYALYYVHLRLVDELKSIEALRHGAESIILSDGSCILTHYAFMW